MTYYTKQALADEIRLKATELSLLVDEARALGLTVTICTAEVLAADAEGGACTASSIYTSVTEQISY